MGTERKIEALKEATQRKRQEALDKTNKAITQLVKENKRISFPMVAKEAGVSVQYLYKYEQIKNRIKYLQEQQKGVSSPSIPQTASDKSRTVIITHLKERIRKLETENRKFRDQIEAISGKLYQLLLIEEQLERFRVENNDLKQQLDECLSRSKEQSYDVKKVTLLNNKKTEQSQINDTIKQALFELGIKLNSTLSKKIVTASSDVVLAAIEALKQAMKEGLVKSPGAWLARAIENGWTKNEPQLQQILYNPPVYKASEQFEEELISTEQIQELWKELNNDANT
ncbi:hypothetical protein CAL7716_078350 [Calothrix sp. PCC 7716]|nr:hypothetical protein CAL7716_057620 [Calothrix sp. PCC 7716]BDA73669.1 hypothetical protein CAL7716_078350 [Calothrix sp. PCC 7716]